MSKQQVVLVTGASTGFGRLTVETLASKGHRVFASMRDPEGRNASAAGDLIGLAKSRKLDIHIVSLDVTDESSVESAIKQVISAAGRIDVLVNNAGIAWSGITETFTDEQVRQMFDTNYFGVSRMNRAVLPYMRDAGSGLIVHITSGVARIVMLFMAHYSASKFAVEALAEAYRYELAPLGVDSVVVEPGAYPTPIMGKMVGGADESRVPGYGAVAELPQRVGESLGAYFESENAPNPQEVADAVATLVDRPAGTRPVRVLVGADVQGIKPLNDVADTVQREWLEGMQLGELTKLKVAEKVTG